MANSERSGAVDGGIVSQLINLNVMSRSIERLSGGLVLSGWAGMMVTRMALMDSCCILVTGGSISAPPST